MAAKPSIAKTLLLPDEVLIEYASAHAELMIKIFGHVAPVWHAIDGDGNHLVMQAATGMSKDEAAAAVAAVVEDKRCTRLMFTDEAWSARDEAGLAWVARHGSLHDYPGRIEIVTIQLENIDGSRLAGERRIIREDGQKPRLGPLEIVKATYSVGRFVGLLPHGKGETRQ
jgi:hypothetical protein